MTSSTCSRRFARRGEFALGFGRWPTDSSRDRDTHNRPLTPPCLFHPSTLPPTPTHTPTQRDDKTRVEILRANVARRDAGSKVPAAQLLEILRTAGSAEARKTILLLFARFLGDDVGHYRAIVDLFPAATDVRTCTCPRRTSAPGWDLRVWQRSIV